MRTDGYTGGYRKPPRGSGRPYRTDRSYGFGGAYNSGESYGAYRPYGSDRSYGFDRSYGTGRSYGAGRSYGPEGAYDADRDFCVRDSQDEDEDSAIYQELKAQLTEYYRRGVKLSLGGVRMPASQIARICTAQRGASYMGDFIVDDAGQLKEVRFDRVSRE